MSDLDIEVEKLQQDVFNEVIEFVLQGYSSTEVVEYLSLNYNFSTENARRYYRRACTYVAENGEFDYDRIIMQHVFYYEEAIRYFDSIGNFAAKAIAMGAKEKLLKIYEDDEAPTVEIENNINISIDQLSFDVNKLSIAEQDRFHNIFSKVKLADGKSDNKRISS